MRKKFNKTLIITVVAILSFFFQVLSVQAATPSISDVYNAAPDGMDLDNDYLNWATTFTGSTSSRTNNVKQLLKKNTKYPSDIMQLLDDGSGTELSSFWGNVKSDQTYNYFDLTRKQVVSAWFYNGDVTSNGADGWAFVLQNDSNGINAISRNENGNPIAGQSLGIWGVGTESLPTASYDPSSTAIQKSYAVVFDAKQNATEPEKYSTSNTADTLDTWVAGLTGSQTKENYIAAGYPGSKYVPGNSSQLNYLEQNYKLGLGILSKTYYYYYRYHVAPSLNNVPMLGYDGEFANTSDPSTAWRHVTFTYTPPTTGTVGTIDYVFNDKYPDGTIKGPGLVNKGTLDIDTSVFGTDVKRVRWGFTAANGSPGTSPQYLSFVMETMPSIADVTPTATIHDVTMNKDLPLLYQKSDLKDSSTVYNGDELKIHYNLKYNDGFAETKPITTQVELPKNITFTDDADGKIGTLTYKDSAGNQIGEAIPISASDIKTVQNHDGIDVGSLNFTLKSMDKSNITDADIELKGIATDSVSTTAQVTYVAPEHTSYRSSNYSGDVMTPAFNLNSESLKLTTSDKLTQYVTENDGLNINGTLKYALNTTFDGNPVSGLAVIDGEKGVELSVNTTSGKGSTSYSSLNIPVNMIGKGNHTVKVYFTDKNGMVSNAITYNVTIQSLNLEAIDPDQTVSSNVENKLTAKLNYDPAKDYDIEQMTAHLTIDGKTKLTDQALQGTSYDDVTVAIPENTLTEGNHTVTLYVSDSDGFKSNTVTYNLTVRTRNLVLTPTNEDITVHDNKPVAITGDYAYNDESDFSAAHTYLKYQITNADGTKQPEVTSTNLTTGAVAKGDFDLKLNPVGKTNGTTGLKEGRNEVKVVVYDGDTQSNEVTYVINVPKMTPELSSNDTTITVLGGFDVEYPMTYTYPDSSQSQKYQLNDQDLTLYATYNGKTKKVSPDIAVSEQGSETPYEINPLLSKSDLGINDDASSPYTISFYTVDPYGRKSNTLDYTLKVIPSGAQIVATNYRFKDIDPKYFQAGYVERDGVWNLKVNSYKSKWVLSAQAGSFKREINGSYTEDSDLTMDYVDPSTGRVAALSGNPQIYNNSQSTQEQETFDITSNWTNNSGILLKDDILPVAGEYQTIAKWTLTDSM